MKVSAQYAQSHLDELMQSADRGEEVEIAGEGNASYRLFLLPTKEATPTAPTKKRLLGAGVGKMKVPTYEEWKAMDKELEELMLADNLDLSCLR